MVKSLELISGIGEMIFRIPSGEEKIVQLSHDLVAVLNSDISPERIPIVSQSHPESNLLSWADGIRKHLQIFNKQWADARGG
jgi:hypothetical protein